MSTQAQIVTKTIQKQDGRIGPRIPAPVKGAL
jgi:hypothetical protein